MISKMTRQFNNTLTAATAPSRSVNSPTTQALTRQLSISMTQRSLTNTTQLPPSTHHHTFPALSPIAADALRLPSTQITSLRSPTSQPLYLGDNIGAPKLKHTPRVTDFQLHCATQNVLHPLVAQAEKQPENRKNERFSHLANAFAEQHIQMINTQESTAASRTAFEQAGYCTIDADATLQKSTCPNAKATAPTVAVVTLGKTDHDNASDFSTRLKADAHQTPGAKCDKVNDGMDPRQRENLTGKWVSTWRGLASYYDPNAYELSEDQHNTFTPYSSDSQKSWPQVWHAFGGLISSLVSPDKFNQIQKKAGDFIASFSGVARQDGLLVSHLKHKDTGQSIILCNTHLESFDHDIRQKQLDQLIENVQKLRQQHPEAVIVLAGDFNTPQTPKTHQSKHCDGLSQLLLDRLSARTMPEAEIVNTLINGNDIDGVYYMPPAGYAITETAGATYLPQHRSQPDIQWSDHCAVMVSATISPTLH